MLSAKNLIRILVNTAIGAVLILVWLRFVNIEDVLHTLSATNIIYLIPAFLALLMSQVIRAVRLKIFLRPVKNIPVSDLIYLTGVATLFNFFIPIRAGEVAKGIYLNSEYKLPLAKSLVWIFLDRFVDFLTVLVAASLLFWVIPTTLPIKFVWTLTIIFIAGVLAAYLLTFKSNLAIKLFNFLKPLLIVNIIKLYFERLLHFFIDTLSIFKRKFSELGLLFIISVLAYGFDAAIFYYVFLAVGSPQSFIKMYLAQLLSALTYLIPSAPGYVGSAEASGVIILSGVFGVGINLSSAMIVLYHICVAIFILIFGLISVYKLKINMVAIINKALRKNKS